MTPPATATVRSTARTAPASRRAPVRHPRRISGPASAPRTAAAMAIPAPGIALPRQRPSRPAVKPRRRPAPNPTRRSVQGAPGIALRAIDAFEGLSSNTVLDRLIRGRAWIGLLAFALIGMVTMQLLVLELNTGIGHTLTRVAQLQRENAQLGIEASTSSAESRIAPLAVSAGMKLAPVETVHFVATSPAYVTRAAAALSNPVQPSSSSQPAQASSVESQATGSEAVTSSLSNPSSTASAGESSSSEPQGSAAAAEAGGSTESSTATSSAQE